MARIFILNTTRSVSTKTYDILRARDHVVVEFSSTEDAERALAQRTPDLLIIEAQILDDCVFELLRRLKGGANPPVVILAPGAICEDRIRGFEAGADDVVHESCSLKELALRAESIIRRCRERTIGT